MTRVWGRFPRMSHRRQAPGGTKHDDPRLRQDPIGLGFLSICVVLLLYVLGRFAVAGPEGRLRTGPLQGTRGDTLFFSYRDGSNAFREREIGISLVIGALEGPDEYLFGYLTALAVSPSGGPVVYDQMARSVRMYDSQGEFLRKVGREGEGPGEHRLVTGIEVLPDGSVVLSDPGNARVSVFDSTGGFRASWPIDHPVVSADRVLYSDEMGRLVHRWHVWNPDTGTMESDAFLLFSGEGTLLDSIRPPPLEVDTLFLKGGVGGIVPFSPRLLWDWHPRGYPVVVQTSEYRVHLLRPPPDSVLQIRVQREAPRLSRSERREWEAVVEYLMRRVEPGWTWRGDKIPRVKPHVKRIMCGRDGRIWVQLHTEAEPSAAATKVDPREMAPRISWLEPNVWDVFGPDGAHIGRFRFPLGVQLLAAHGTKVWGVVQDSLGIQRVARIDLPPANPSTTSSPGPSEIAPFALRAH